MGLFARKRASEPAADERRRTSRPSGPRLRGIAGGGGAEAGGRSGGGAKAKAARGAKRAKAAKGRDDAQPPRKNRRDPSAAETKAPKPNRRSAPAVPRMPLLPRIADRARAASAAVRRPAMIVLKVVMVIAVAAGTIAIARLVDRHVRTAPTFAVRTITLAGNEKLTRDEVLQAAGLSVGQNSFDVAPEEAQARLAAHPWIAEVEVRRELPDGYTIQLRERHAVAILALGSLYLVAEDGTVFKQVTPEDDVDLPVITGVSRTRFTGDRAYRASIVLEVVALLHDYRGAGLWRSEPIAEVHVEEDDGLSLYIGEEPTYVRLGRGPFRGKLQRLRQILDRLKRDEARAAYVYLDNVRRPDRVTVRLR